MYIFIYIKIDVWSCSQFLFGSGPSVCTCDILRRILCLFRILFSVNQVENNVLKISTLNQLGSQQDEYCRGFNNSIYM